MTAHTYIMLAIGVLCWADGCLWLPEAVPAALAFFGFGLGYFALAEVFA